MSPIPRRVLLYALLTTAAILRSQTSVPADFASRADRLCSGFVEQKKFMGSVLVARAGKPLFRKSYGFANAEWDVANTPDTKFRLGSITKQFTATAILQLVEQGKLRLDDPISKYYADAPKTWEKVTIHNLLNHTSGIPSYTGIPNFFGTGSKLPLTPAQIVKLTQDKPLEFEPGAKFAYDNTGYILLGYVIEKITGKPYAGYLRQAIFDPLGMKDTGYDVYEAILKHRASGYSMSGASMINSPYLDMTLPYAAGSLYSTVDDLSTWDRALYTDKVLTADSRKKMFTPGLSNYGYGWFIDQRFNRSHMEHGGGINGFNTVISRYPGDKVLVVVLSNLNSNIVEKIGTGLAALLFGEP
ncbi:MAG: serine hydrolase domain-containing protein [Bryobacteraceae bacterium]